MSNCLLGPNYQLCATRSCTNRSATVFYHFLLSAAVGFTTKDVVYKWWSKNSHEAIERAEGLSISEFEIGYIGIFETTTLYRTGESKVNFLVVHAVLIKAGSFGEPNQDNYVYELSRKRQTVSIKHR